MKDQSLSLLKHSFKNFYFKHPERIEIPPSIGEREFGYKQFNNGMIRHLSFKENGELHAHLIRNIPSDFYCSCAYYDNPSAPMQEKVFRGADLIFDIDADELALACKRKHEVWKCNNCKNVMKGEQNCSKCKSSKVEKTSLACDNCIDAGKKETIKLVTLLHEDFGVNEEQIKIYFSGNHGFHLHVYSEEFRELDSSNRADIANYLIGNNLIPESFGLRRDLNDVKDVMLKFPTSKDLGWRGRIARKLMKDDKTRQTVIRRILKNGYLQFKTELNAITREIGVQLDPKVTMDIHRVFRMPGTLNSKSGLLKDTCKSLEEYDPFSSACVLSDEEVKIDVKYSPKFRLSEDFYGPFKNEVVKLPTFAAAYLVCKGLADVV